MFSVITKICHDVASPVTSLLYLDDLMVVQKAYDVSVLLACWQIIGTVGTISFNDATYMLQRIPSILCRTNVQNKDADESLDVTMISVGLCLIYDSLFISREITGNVTFILSNDCVIVEFEELWSRQLKSPFHISDMASMGVESKNCNRRIDVVRYLCYILCRKYHITYEQKDSYTIIINKCATCNED